MSSEWESDLDVGRHWPCVDGVGGGLTLVELVEYEHVNGGTTMASLDVALSVEYFDQIWREGVP